jgi:hypothetical protein
MQLLAGNSKIIVFVNGKSAIHFKTSRSMLYFCQGLGYLKVAMEKCIK